MEACRSFEEGQETFVVRVSRRQGGAWQGNVIWIGERSEQRFDNMQELISLMDSTLHDPADE